MKFKKITALLPYFNFSFSESQCFKCLYTSIMSNVLCQAYYSQKNVLRLWKQYTLLIHKYYNTRKLYENRCSIAAWCLLFNVQDLPDRMRCTLPSLQGLDAAQERGHRTCKSHPSFIEVASRS